MNIQQVNPYINLDGSAALALEFYAAALDGKAEGVMKFGDAPGMNIPEEQKNRIMHSELRVSGGVIMISDSMPGQPPAPTGNLHIVLSFGDVADITKAFEALSAGGTVVQPLQDTFWGAKFGMLIDQFGVPWMMNCQLEKPTEE